MIAVSIFVLSLFVGSLKVKKSFVTNELYEKGFDFDNTNALRGLLALCIMLCHITKHVRYQLPIIPFSIMASVGVGIFLFLSGYALVWSSIARKDYFEHFLSKRFKKIIIPYILLTICYAVIVCGMAQSGLSTIPASFLKGNPFSNSWYVIACIFFYFCYYICFRNINFNDKKQVNRSIIAIAILLLIYAFVIRKVLKWPDWWYKTCPEFVLGIIFGAYKETIELKLSKNYSVILGITIMFSVIAYFFPAIFVRIMPELNIDVWLINDFLMGLAGVFCIVLIFFKCSFRNKCTLFLGNISYEIYLFHGLFIELLVCMGWSKMGSVEQELASVAIAIMTILFAIVFHWVSKQIMRKIKV